jgi:hypothetical protein
MKLSRLKTPEPYSVMLRPGMVSEDFMIASLIKAVF